MYEKKQNKQLIKINQQNDSKGRKIPHVAHYKEQKKTGFLALPGGVGPGGIILGWPGGGPGG